ncbi:MAG: Arc family DNA-binding protein [Xylophilus ampelinus]
MKANPSPSHIADRYIIRFPEGMRNKILNVAKTNNRSINAEIITRLECTFRNESAANDSLAAQLLTTQVQLDLADFAIQNMALRRKLREIGNALLDLATGTEQQIQANEPTLLEKLKNIGSEALELESEEIDPSSTGLEQWVESQRRKNAILEQLILLDQQKSHT